ncbi:hypothetical protein B0H14DRAFT_239369 [Mycena olivaceomarginata]|nr:hypothetical protein B0H14DRAFT_239369 [Mycena olivaceomarginata]
MLETTAPSFGPSMFQLTGTRSPSVMLQPAQRRVVSRLPSTARAPRFKLHSPAQGEHRHGVSPPPSHYTPLTAAIADRYSPASERALPHRHTPVFFMFRRTRGVALHLLLYPDLCLVHSSPGAEGRSAYLSNARYTPSSPSSAPANGSRGCSFPPHSTTSPRHSAHLPMHLTPSSLSCSRRRPLESASSPPPTTIIPGAEGRSPSSPSSAPGRESASGPPAPLYPHHPRRGRTQRMSFQWRLNPARHRPHRQTEGAALLLASLYHTPSPLSPAPANGSRWLLLASLYTQAHALAASLLFSLSSDAAVPSRPAFSRGAPRTAENGRRRSIWASSFPGVPPAITLRPGTTKVMDNPRHKCTPSPRFFAPSCAGPLHLQ